MCVHAVEFQQWYFDGRRRSVSLQLACLPPLSFVVEVWCAKERTQQLITRREVCSRMISPIWKTITDERTRSWIKTENDRTISSLERSPRFRRYLESALKSLDESGADLKAATFRLSLRDGWIYELSSGSVHPRGIWRRTRLDSYLASKPECKHCWIWMHSQRGEGRSWTLARGADIDFSPSGTRCLLVLSDGGSQTFELREFDVERADFVEDGFVVPAARNPSATWRDNNTVVVATDFGTASSKNREGLPIVVKEWSRGQSLSQARELFRGEPDDYAVMIVPGRDTATPAKRRVCPVQAPSRHFTHFA